MSTKTTDTLKVMPFLRLVALVSVLTIENCTAGLDNPKYCDRLEGRQRCHVRKFD